MPPTTSYPLLPLLTPPPPRPQTPPSGPPPPFKTQFTPHERRRASMQMLLSRPTHIPIIIEKAPHSALPGPTLLKILIPPERQVAHLLHLIRRRTRISPTQALFVLVGGVLPPTSMELGSLFEQCREGDGFLYVVYAGEETFGGE